MREKTVTIKVNPRTKDNVAYFEVDSKNMEKYEIIGIMELAIFKLKQDCLNITKKEFPIETNTKTSTMNRGAQKKN